MHLEPASCYLDGPSRPSSSAKWWAGGGQIGDEVRPQKQAEVAWCTTALVAQVARAKKAHTPLFFLRQGDDIEFVFGGKILDDQKKFSGT